MTFKALVCGSASLRSATAVWVLATACSAQAAVGLYNTGVDDAGVVLGLGQLDTHYSVLGGGSAYAVSNALNYPGYWAGPNALSSWDTPVLGAGNTGGDSALTAYTFQTTFDMTGMNLVGATITGRVTADNGITSILLNGVGIPFTFGDPNSGVYTGFTPFTLAQGFTSGINTLTFGIVNASGPTGLRVEMSNNFQVTAVPEPESYAMLLAGLGLMGVVSRRRKCKAKV